MLKSRVQIFFFTIVLSAFNQVQAYTTAKLDCQEYSAKDPISYTFGLDAEFNLNSAILVNKMDVISRYGSITHIFKNPVSPAHSVDQIKGVEKDTYNRHFMYNLEYRNGCQFSLHTPNDIISYQKFVPNLNNKFSVVYMRVCSFDFNKNFSKTLECRFKSK